MKIEFFKYQGTGNDFILIDGLNKNVPYFTPPEIAQWCHRRFGIGADGYIVLRPSARGDFYMDYSNSDGQVSSLCGNGSRCAVHLAKTLGIGSHEIVFEAFDGLHRAKVIDEEIIAIEMFSSVVRQYGHRSRVVDTGSPHFVQYVDDLELVDVVKEGREIRNSESFQNDGINVNFVQRMGKNELRVATYERGVESQTYSCGTGVTAAAVVEALESNPFLGQHLIKIQTLGGKLEVEVALDDQGVDHLWLRGPATMVFKGELNIKSK